MSRLPREVVELIDALAPGEDLLLTRDGDVIATVTSTSGEARPRGEARTGEPGVRDEAVAAGPGARDGTAAGELGARGEAAAQPEPGVRGEARTGEPGVRDGTTAGELGVRGEAVAAGPGARDGTAAGELGARGEAAAQPEPGVRGEASTGESGVRGEAAARPEIAGDVTVVATAMRLSESARASLSAELGADYIVIDMHAAPLTADVLLVPPVSPQLIGNLRRSFPKARVVVAEIDDAELGVSYEGPVRRMLDAGATTYLPSTTIPRLAQALDRTITQGRQITGGRRAWREIEAPPGHSSA
ncbi:hypothetical protein [Amycolatopsis deserti]|uniref:hypothetical protein n=1 Tax=Amycolatopsis deserti TaxID=185696 RepID=UPI0027E593D5|nr:hypothetical protein [Amycolatopsis deserti]